MSRAAIIANKHLATGFRLAGVDAFPIENVEEARAVLSRIVSEKRHDIVISHRETFKGTP